MDSFELNKMIGAFLAVVFVVFSVSLVSDTIFAAHAPETPGYAIEVPEQVAGDGAPADAGPSVLSLVADADAGAGETVFRRCASCHTVDEGGANRVGPNLFDIVDRPVASKEGFSYSAAMREFGADGTVWDYQHLIDFLHDPRGYVPGTTMAFAGIRNPQEEANLIAYLRTLSNDPAPLPEVEEEETATEEGEEPAAGDEATDEAAPAEDEEAPAATDEDAVEDEAADPATTDEAAPAGDEAAPAEDEAAPAADEAAPADDEATEAEPVQPTPEDDGTAAGPQPDAGTPAGDETDEEELEIVE